MITTDALLVALIVAAVTDAALLTYLHWPQWQKMDGFDLLARGGIVAVLLAVAASGVMVLVGLGLFWRLPVVVATLAATSAGLFRDAIHMHDERRKQR
jgi:hypothetical protein